MTSSGNNIGSIELKQGAKGFDLSILHQGTHWATATGQLIAVRELGAEYAHNIARALLENAPSMYLTSVSQVLDPYSDAAICSDVLEPLCTDPFDWVMCTEFFNSLESQYPNVPRLGDLLEEELTAT
jgi:hypothetical protein